MEHIWLKVRNNKVFSLIHSQISSNGNIRLKYEFIVVLIKPLTSNFIQNLLKRHIWKFMKSILICLIRGILLPRSKTWSCPILWWVFWAFKEVDMLVKTVPVDGAPFLHLSGDILFHTSVSKSPSWIYNDFFSLEVVQVNTGYHYIIHSFRLASITLCNIRYLATIITCSKFFFLLLLISNYKLFVPSAKTLF